MLKRLLSLASTTLKSKGRNRRVATRRTQSPKAQVAKGVARAAKKHL